MSQPIACTGKRKLSFAAVPWIVALLGTTTSAQLMIPPPRPAYSYPAYRYAAPGTYTYTYGGYTYAYPYNARYYYYGATSPGPAASYPTSPATSVTGYAPSYGYAASQPTYGSGASVAGYRYLDDYATGRGLPLAKPWASPLR